MKGSTKENASIRICYQPANLILLILVIIIVRGIGIHDRVPSLLCEGNALAELFGQVLYLIVILLLFFDLSYSSTTGPVQTRLVWYTAPG
jgi:hypothetical protein